MNFHCGELQMYLNSKCFVEYKCVVRQITWRMAIVAGQSLMKGAPFGFKWRIYLLSITIFDGVKEFAK